MNKYSDYKTHSEKITSTSSFSINQAAELEHLAPSAKIALQERISRSREESE